MTGLWYLYASAAVLIIFAGNTEAMVISSFVNWMCEGRNNLTEQRQCELDQYNGVAAINNSVVGSGQFATTILYYFQTPCDESPDRTDCFVNPVTGEKDCSYDTSTNQLTCTCPGLGVAYTETLDTAIYKSGVDCTDIDECAIGVDNCDPIRATCTDSVGSFSCACKFGFQGDGVTCDPYYDECAVPVAPLCAENADCANVKRDAGCYSPVGNLQPNTVTDAFGCIEQCHGNATYAAVSNDQCYCTDTIPINSGASCTLTCPGNSNFKCGNTAGSAASYYRAGYGHTCTCQTGYEGDPDGFTACVDINECSSTTVSFGTCINTVGSFRIECDEGYILSGSNCVQATVVPCNSTADGTLGGIEMWDSGCAAVNVTDCDGANGKLYTLTGTTNGACTNNVLVPALDLSTFSITTFVTNRNGFSLLRPYAECTQTTMAFMIDRFVANEAGFYLPDMGMGDIPVGGTSQYLAACRGVKFFADGAFYRFELPLTSTGCGFTKTQVSSYVIDYTMTVIGEVGTDSGLITRRRTLALGATCSYTIKGTSVSSRYYVYTLGSVSKRSTQTSAAQLTAKSDSTFTSNYDRTKAVKWNELSYVEASVLPNPSNRFTIRWLQCWESPSAQPSDLNRRYVLKNGCDAQSETSTESVKIYKNAEPTARLGFYPRSFGGGDPETIYLHCLIDVCDTKSTKCCSDVCKNRDKSSFHVSPTFKLITSDPITVKDVCGGTKNGGCEQVCSVTEQGKGVCSCVAGFEVDPADNTKCKVVPNRTPRRGGDAFKWYYVVIPILALLGIAVVVAVCVKLRTPNQAYKLPELADLADT